jgi:hypothetical protein
VSKSFLELIYPSVELALKSKVKSDLLQQYIAKYFDRNHDVLFDTGVSKRLFFRAEDEFIIFKATDIKPSEVEDILKRNKLIKSTWEILNNPFNITIMLISRYYLLKEDKKSLENSLMYLSLFLYSSLHYKYFKFLPNENVMAYTVNNLSNKYYIKTQGNLVKAIYSTVMTNHETYDKVLARGTDEDLLRYITQLRTRLNSFIKNIAKEYYNTKEKGLYLNTEKESQDQEDFYEVDNISFQINKMADKATLRILTRGIDQLAINAAADICGVSNSAIKTAMYNIIEQRSDEVKDLVTLILQAYLINNKNSIDSMTSKKFISECFAIYSKSNTNDKTINNIKEILDRWLTACSDKYTKTERVATKINFRKAIYLYFVFMIRQSIGN